MAGRPTFRVYIAESYRQRFEYRSGTSSVESRGVTCDVYNKEKLFLHLLALADYQIEPHNLVARHGIRNPLARVTIVGAEKDRWWFSKGPSTAHWPGIRAIRCRWNGSRPESLVTLPATRTRGMA
jgi:hypothetical protein